VEKKESSTPCVVEMRVGERAGIGDYIQKKRKRRETEGEGVEGKGWRDRFAQTKSSGESSVTRKPAILKSGRSGTD